MLETIQIRDGVPLHLAWHQERMDRSVYEIYGQTNELILKELVKVPGDLVKGVVKCRFIYGPGGWRTEYVPYSPRKIESLKLVEVTQLDYRFKYSDREELDFLSTQKGDCDEILMVIDDRVCDTSFSNIVFFNGTDWITPDSPLLEGTCRKRLIDSGRIGVSEIRPRDLEKFTHFRLINAMLDFDEQPMVEVSKIME